MTYPYIFQNESGSQPASQLDTMFQVAGQQGNIPCTATGTNVITLVSQTNCYSPAAYTDKQIVSWTAVATSTSSVTMSAFGLGVLNYYDATGVQSTSGSIQNGVHYVSQYCADLNSGAGGFITLNTTGTTAVNTPVPVMGSFKNLLITNTTTTTAASQIAVSFDEAVLENSSGGTVKVGSGFSGTGGLSFTINANASGANGIDTGTFGTGTYYIWVIYNQSTTTTAGLLSLSSTTPTLPSGYSYKARAGACIAVAGPKFNNWMQKGRRTQYLVGTYNGNALAALPLITNAFGAAWTTNATAVAANLPTTAMRAMFQIQIQLGAANGTAVVAPNNNYSTAPNTSPFPPISFQGNANGIVGNLNTVFDMELETFNVYTGSANLTSASLSVFGWEDNVNA